MELAVEEFKLEDGGGARTRAQGRGRQDLEREDGKPAGTRTRGRRCKGIKVGGARARARARGRETVESSRRRERRELEGGRPSRVRGGREAGGRSVGSDASGTPTIARERGRWEVRGARYGGGRPGKAGGSSSTTGLPLDEEDCSFDFRCRDLNFEESNYSGGFCKNTFILRTRHLKRAEGGIRCL
jgi:hypothetical protein